METTIGVCLTIASLSLGLLVYCFKKWLPKKKPQSSAILAKSRLQEATKKDYVIDHGVVAGGLENVFRSTDIDPNVAMNKQEYPRGVREGLQTLIRVHNTHQGIETLNIGLNQLQSGNPYLFQNKEVPFCLVRKEVVIPEDKVTELSAYIANIIQEVVTTLLEGSQWLLHLKRIHPRNGCYRINVLTDPMLHLHLEGAKLPEQYRLLSSVDLRLVNRVIITLQPYGLHGSKVSDLDFGRFISEGIQKYTLSADEGFIHQYKFLLITPVMGEITFPNYQERLKEYVKLIQ